MSRLNETVFEPVLVVSSAKPSDPIAHATSVTNSPELTLGAQLECEMENKV